LRTGKKGSGERAENPSEIAGRGTRVDPIDKGSLVATPVDAEDDFTRAERQAAWLQNARKRREGPYR